MTIYDIIFIVGGRMKSRMEKYYKDEDKLQRTTRNDALYEELYRERQVPRSNVTVIDNINEIDITKIKAMVSGRENYRKVRKYENLVSPIDIKKEDIVEYEFDEIDDNNYDINKILENKRSNRVNRDEEKVRKITNTQYDILKSLTVQKNEEEEMSTDFMTQEKNLKDLMNTIVNGNKIENTDLFANLKEEPSEKENEETFYTSSTKFDDDDFGNDAEKKENNSNVFIIIAVLAVLIAIGVFVYIKFF